MPTWLTTLLTVLSAILADVEVILKNPTPTAQQMSELGALLQAHAAISGQLQQAAGTYQGAMLQKMQGPVLATPSN